MKLPKPLLVSVVGPTAVGKTDFTIKLATHFGSEIISVDSRQFYKEMEIGTAKPSKKELKKVPHHLINSHHIHEEINAGHFEMLAIDLLNQLYQKFYNLFLTKFLSRRCPCLGLVLPALEFLKINTTVIWL